MVKIGTRICWYRPHYEPCLSFDLFQKTYGSFHYTSLLYLSDYATDFDGGRLVFVDGASGNVTVEPKKGAPDFIFQVGPALRCLNMHATNLVLVFRVTAAMKH